MEENKYYTPQIEEFFIGFEFEEEFKNPNWSKLARPLEDTYEFVKLKLDTSHSLSRITSKLKNNRVRVKYLDKEDILSLGFTDKPIAVDQKFSYYKLLKENKVCQISTYWDMNRSKRDNLIRIYVGYLNKYPYTEIFRGNIKNKSELQKLLKQLEI